MSGNLGKKLIDDVTTAFEACDGDFDMRAETADQITESFQHLLERTVPIRLVE